MTNTEKPVTGAGISPRVWYSNPKQDARQGLIYDESTGRNIAVSYDPKDALLIATAPELLTAAREVIDGLRGQPPIKGEAALVAAIAKAESEAQ